MRKSKYNIDVWDEIYKTIILKRIICMIIELIIGCLIIVFWTKTIAIQYLLGMMLAVAMMLFLVVNAKRIYFKAVYYAPLILVPAGALMIVYFLISNWSDELLKKAEILEFSGQYLAFCGAFCLGYFIFANDKEKKREKQIDDIDYLSDIISKSVIDSINLRNIVENASSDDDLDGRVGLITTVDNWHFYYREYERLYGDNAELKRAVDIHFRRIDNVNRLIKEGLFKKANELNQKYIEDDYYNTMKYNPSNLLLDFGNDSTVVHNKMAWFKQADTKKKIMYICENYADIIETLIYNYMKIHGISTSDVHTTNIAITNQLIEKSSYFNDIVRFPTDKRIITKAIEICSQSFKQGSNMHNIELIWGEYNLCDEIEKV